ncbi:hypothetical protein ACO0K7_13290 [Undibacterium sp. Ji67W]|uniref:hypothetical protein n=1 Tax=Undibacterium sp. Ji67W TaxID=3413042 RepID=UPI003BF08F1A
MKIISLRLLIIYLMLVMLPLQSLAASGWPACLSISSMNDERAESLSHCDAMSASFASQEEMQNKGAMKKMNVHGYCQSGTACCCAVTLPVFHLFTSATNRSDATQIAASPQFSSFHSARLERPPKFFTA